MARVKLTGIPPELQQLYNVGEEVVATGDGGRCLNFQDKDGKWVNIELMELFGHDICIERMA